MRITNTLHAYVYQVSLRFIGLDFILGREVHVHALFDHTCKCTCFLPLQLYQFVTVNYKTTAELQQNNNNL